MWRTLFLFFFCFSSTLKDSSGRIIVIERDGRTLSNHPTKDITNLNGSLVRFVYFKIEDAIRQGDRETEFIGVYGDIWSLLGEYLNFTLVGRRLDRKQYPGVDDFDVLLKILTKGKSDVIPFITGSEDERVDYILPFFSFKEQFYIRPELKTNEKWLFVLIEYRIWLVMGIFLVLMAIVGWIADHFLVPKILRFSMGDQLFYNFSNLCIQDTQPNNFKNRFHVLTIVRCVLVFMFWGYFGTFLYAQLTVKIVVEPFSNVQELLEKTDMKIFATGRFFRKGALKWTLDNPVYKKRIELFPEEHHTFNEVCLSDEGTTALTTTNFFYSITRSECELHRIGGDIANINFLAAARKGFRFKRSMNIGILKLKESGLLQRIHDRWYPPVIKVEQSLDVEPLTLNHFKYVFLVWGLIMILSFIIFVGEVIVWNYREKKKEKERRIRLEEKRIRLANIPLYPFVL